MPSSSDPKQGETKRIMSRGLRGKEDALYLKWSEVVSPSDVLHELLSNSDHARTLFHGLRRQVESLRRRSLSYDDGEVTIYDRVLLRLYDDGHTMEHYGLFEFYLAEHLGTQDCGSEKVINSVIAAHFAAQRVLDDGPISNIPVNAISTVEQIGNDQKDGNSLQRSDKPKPANLNKLIQVYQKAKADYYILEVTESHRERTNSVRFLRDTAENLLRYLNSVDTHHELIPELEDIIKVSQAHANQLAGGRKRKFEHSDNDSTGSQSASPYRSQGYSRMDRYVPDGEGWDHSHVLGKTKWDSHSHNKKSRWAPKTRRWAPKEEWDHSRAFDSYRPS
ncbi:hypothetical protein N7457_004393 [Penicillium paradoxum]|uniref:uncharacterized protein n=1 Tax=Penicillium paradoxum TaxID=176176 RepID=UPI0025492C46|nr:uncharacterized protein N7457_004393 [Penicillium paradoxum]KAJ5782619.1 hypothetical protein N7457_004393 [Penicillium paradoxum]